VIDDEVQRLRHLLQNAHQVPEPSVLAKFADWIKRGQPLPKSTAKPPADGGKGLGAHGEGPS